MFVSQNNGRSLYVRRGGQLKQARMVYMLNWSGFYYLKVYWWYNIDLPIIQAKLAEIEMARLEHAKLMAKIQKKQEEKRVIKVTYLPLSTCHVQLYIVQWRGNAWIRIC